LTPVDPVTGPGNKTWQAVECKAREKKGKLLFWISGLKSSPSRIWRRTKYIYIPGAKIQGRFI
jgi:hypothetical protein